MRSAFTTPSRARCTLGISVAASTPFDATLLYELTSNVLQRKLFNCISITTNKIVVGVVLLLVITTFLHKTFSLIVFFFLCSPRLVSKRATT